MRYPGRKLRFKEGEFVDRAAQSRLLMLHAGFEWTSRRDDFIATLDTQSAREMTRTRGQSTKLLGMYPWARVFEEAAGRYWIDGIAWDEASWIHFVRTVLKDAPEMLDLCILKDPKPWKENEEEEPREKKEDLEKISKRLAAIYLDQTEFVFTPGRISVELMGDSQCVIRWLEGLNSITNTKYASSVMWAQNTTNELADRCGLQAANLGRNVWKWIYREGNARADELTWTARRGRCCEYYDTDFLQEVKDCKIMISGIKGGFDGGRSFLGVGCGWFLDCHFCALPSSSYYNQAGWRQNVGYKSFLLPAKCTITEAELQAAQELLLGVVQILIKSGIAPVGMGLGPQRGTTLPGPA